MKKIIFLILLSISAVTIYAGNSSIKTKGKNKVIAAHRIVFQLTTNDTLAHKSLIKQLNNITSVEPTTQIEVVCHGPGIDMLVQSKSIVHDKIIQLNAKGIAFIACEFSLKERNITKEQIIQEAGYVKAGIIEIVSKQEAGWSYIKSGF